MSSRRLELVACQPIAFFVCSPLLASILKLTLSSHRDRLLVVHHIGICIPIFNSSLFFFAPEPQYILNDPAAASRPRILRLKKRPTLE